MEIIRRLGAFFLDILQIIVFAISLFLFMYLLVLQPHKIKGDSMQPNFPDGEYLLTDKVTYRFESPQRGDVIVFVAPVNEEDDYIKRIIGLPGESVSISNGQVFINGRQLNETYLDPLVYSSGGQFLPNDTPVTVPADEYFVMGDNRPYSSDSRSWGFVPKKNITGKAWFIYWPLSRSGTVANISYSF
jgi:signal peptidase I